MAPTVYTPDNVGLEAVLAASGGRGFSLDEARLMIHWVYTKQVIGYTQRGKVLLGTEIMRKWIHDARLVSFGWTIMEALDELDRKFEALDIEPTKAKLVGQT